jgi:hypothetical protein
MGPGSWKPASGSSRTSMTRNHTVSQHHGPTQVDIVTITTRVVDPDPDSMTLWIRIRIGNPYPGS